MDIRDKTLEIECIYFDMDGVLVDFKRGQREILKIEVVDQENKRKGDDDLLFSKMREYDHFYNMLQPIEGSLALSLKRSMKNMGIDAGSSLVFQKRAGG